MPTLLKRETARRDLVDPFVHLAENAGLDVARSLRLFRRATGA